jgi:limonene-1,2-epoxide hydrolase
MSTLTQINPIEQVNTYFIAQNQSDADGVVNLFAEGAEVYNVNFPKFAGKEGIRAFCENLYARTSARNFQIVSIAQGEGNVIMAHWEVTMSFRPGAKVGSFELARGFDVSLQGINKFMFDDSGRIHELRVFHETSTVAQLAKENAIS